MKRWRHRERLGDLIESARGEYVLFDEAERYGGSEYARGYANGSGDEGYYQREIARLRGTLSLAEEGLANYAQELEGAKHDIDRLMAACNHEANEVERMKSEILEARRVGRPPEALWLQEPQTQPQPENNDE